MDERKVEDQTTKTLLEWIQMWMSRMMRLKILIMNILLKLMIVCGITDVYSFFNILDNYFMLPKYLFF